MVQHILLLDEEIQYDLLPCSRWDKLVTSEEHWAFKTWVVPADRVAAVVVKVLGGILPQPVLDIVLKEFTVSTSPPTSPRQPASPWSFPFISLHTVSLATHAIERAEHTVLRLSLFAGSHSL